MKTIIIIIVNIFIMQLNAEYYLNVSKNFKNSNIIIKEKILNNKENLPFKNVFNSCKEVLDSGNSTGDGFYEIQKDGIISEVFCDMTTNGGGWTQLNKSEINNTMIGDGRQYVKTTNSLGVYGASQGIHIIAIYQGQNLGVNLLENRIKPSTTSNYFKPASHPDGYSYFGGHNYFENNGITPSTLTFNNSIVVFSTGLVGEIRIASNGSPSSRESSYIYYSAYDFELYEKL